MFHLLPQSPHLPGGRDFWHHPIQPPEFADEGTEAQGRKLTFPRSHSSIARQDLVFCFVLFFSIELRELFVYFGD